MCVRVCFMRLSSRDIYYKYVCKYILSLYPRVPLILLDGPANETDSAGTLGFQACSVTRQSKRYSVLKSYYTESDLEHFYNYSSHQNAARTKRERKRVEALHATVGDSGYLLGTSRLHWRLRLPIGDCALLSVTAPPFWCMGSESALIVVSCLSSFSP